MIPITLEFSGLASYQEKVSIDFSTLVSGRLFGIFGPVGSGKSAILDAISYVLYGQTDRLGQQRAAENLMNLQSQSMEISFEFLFHKERYLFTYMQKRQKNNFTKLGKSDRSAYHMVDNQWQPLKETGGKSLAESVLGIGYDNFRRTVIIPQGKFQELLHISNTERTKMMQNLFQLERYDLSDKIQRKYNENEQELIRLQTRMDSLGVITEKTIQEKQARQEGLLKEANRLKKELEESRAHQQFLQESRRLVDTHAEQSATLQARKERLQKGQAELAAMKQQFQSLEASVKEHPQKERTLQELQRCLQWKQQEAQFRGLQQESASVSKQLQQVINQDTQLQQTLTQLQKDYEEITPFLIDAELLMTLSGWFQEDLRLKRELEREDFQQEHLSIEEKHLLERWQDENLLATATASGHVLSHAEGQAMGKEITIFELHKQHLTQALEQAQEQYHRISIDHRLAALSEELKEGEPCPVCGSEEHPYVAHGNHGQEGVGAAKDSIELKITHLQGSLNSLQLAYEQQQAHKAIAMHTDTYQWESICPLQHEAFEQFRLQQKRFSGQKEKLLGRMQDEQRTREQLQKTISRLQDRKNRIDLQVAEMEGSAKTLDPKLLNTYAEVTQEELANTIQTLTNTMQQEKQHFQELEQKQQGHKEGIAKISGMIEDLESQVALGLKRIKEQQPQVEKLLVLYKIPSLEAWQPGQMVEPIQEEYEDIQVELKDIERQILGDTEALAGAKQVAEELAQREERKARFKLLQKLFRAKGFVNFVSHRYLVELCARANERFVTFSHNAMRLELDPTSGEMMVRDHYNNGHLRSVKTLSGGQTFQASFSFALAMVEMIGRGKENFFFLDEGFGTLDSEALETVFRTLQSMYKERKIVGVISHVESLKEEIPVYLEVSTHSKGGSKVELVMR